MIYKFLSLLFFCGACTSVFAQDLQSPQINQNAIFANPGLAGSKGQARICTALASFNSKYAASNRTVYNGLVSADGLIMKNRLGIAGYIKNESFNRTNTYNSYLNGIQTYTHDIKYNYTNLYMGLMLAPKLEITAKNKNKQNHVLSPALAIGFKGTQFDYSGTDFYNSTTQDSIKNGSTRNTFGLDYASLSLLYSSTNSYSGIKLNFENYRSRFLLYSVSFVFAKTYSNKTVKEPKFSFTHQFQLCIPTYQFARVNGYNSYFDNMNSHNLSNYLNANFDFRYGKFIFATFIGFVEYTAFYAGLTGGIQLKNTKIIVNYSPRLAPKNHGSSGLFISANFLLPPKSKSYR